MIGTFARSTHHLEKSGGYLQPIKIVAIRNTNVIEGEIVAGKNRDGRKRYFFFQHVNNNIDRHQLREYCDAETEKIVGKMLVKYPRCTSFSSLNDLRSFGTQIMILPKDFDEQYDTFLKQNKKIIMPIIGKYLDSSSPLSKTLFAICENANFYVWAAKNIFQNRIFLMTIYRIMVWNKKYPQLVSKLRKGTITAYNNTSLVLSLLQECQELRKNKRANDIINMFNTEQKKLLKGNFNSLPIDVLNKFAILSRVKQQNFIRKVSTMTDLNEILRLMAFTTSKHFDWNKQSLLDYIHNVEGLNCKIVLENETSVLVEVKDYETIKKLAKTTNWCISKNKTYWNNYAGKRGDATQYVLFDFSKKEDDELSIVGFTTIDNKGITHAHSFTNANLMTDSMEQMDVPYEGVLKNKNVRTGIYTVISNNHIPLSLVTKFNSRFPIWTKSAFLDQITKILGKGKFTIYYEDDKKLVVAINTWEGIANLLGDTYLSKFSDSYRECEHIFFADFSVGADNNDKLKFAIVTHSAFNSSYQSAREVYNEYCIKNEESFNTELDRFNLPYDIICRPNTTKNRFLEAIFNHDINEIDKFISGNDEIKELLHSKMNNEVKSYFRSELYTSLRDYMSVQLLDVIEKNGFHLEDFLSISNISDIIIRFYGDCANCGGYGEFHNEFNKEENFTKLLNGDMHGWSEYQKVYVSKYYLLDRIIKPYRHNPKLLNSILENLMYNIEDYHYAGFVTDELVGIMLELVSSNSFTQAFNNVVAVIFNNNIRGCIDTLCQMEINDEKKRSVILAYAPSKYNNMFRKKWGMAEKVASKYVVDDSLSAKLDVFSATYSPFDTYTTF